MIDVVKVFLEKMWYARRVFRSMHFFPSQELLILRPDLEKTCEIKMPNAVTTMVSGASPARRFCLPYHEFSEW